MSSNLRVIRRCGEDNIIWEGDFEPCCETMDLSVTKALEVETGLSKINKIYKVNRS